MSECNIDFFELSRNACHCIWELRDVYKFKSYCSEDIDITGFCDTDNVTNGDISGVNIFPFLQDTSLTISIDYENYRESFRNESCCIMICEHKITITGNDTPYPQSLSTTLSYSIEGAKAKIVNAHFSVYASPENSYDNLIQKIRQPAPQLYDDNSMSAYYRELILSNCDLLIECDTSDYILRYDMKSYQVLFDDDTYFTNPDRWFWNICDNRVHPDDCENLDIFRRVDIDKRIRNHVTKVETTFRVKNKKHGYIWIKMWLISKINDNQHLEKMAMIFSRVDNSQFDESEFLEKSRRDKLTKIYNRTYFEYLCSIALKNAHHSATLAMVLFNVDHFRLVNDTFGHLTGDLILSQLARSLTTFFGRNSLVGRVAGDSFAVLVSNMPSHYEVTKLIDNFLKNACRTHFEMGTSLDIHCSAGIAFIDESNIMSLPTIEEQAKSALLQAKANGRNCYVVYSNDSDDDES